MAEAQIPVDLFNPGQVFACLGFLEAADILLGDAEGGFDWSDEADVKFVLRAAGERNPFEAVLEFLAEAEPIRWAHIGYADPPPKKKKDVGAEGEGDSEAAASDVDPAELQPGGLATSIGLTETFYAKEGDRMSLPIRFGGRNRPMVELGHWADGSSRESFKLYAGNRSAHTIARGMLLGVRQLWEEQRDALVSAPLDTLAPMGGSFNFDPRGAWTAIDAGYSPNEHKHKVNSSPVAEFLAAWGLEHARPEEFATRLVRYAVWRTMLPPILARAALGGGVGLVPSRYFQFELALSGKNKVVTFSQEENTP